MTKTIATCNNMNESQITITKRREETSLGERKRNNHYGFVFSELKIN